MTEPAANLLRFGEVLDWIELPERALLEIVATGQLGGAALVPGGRRFYLREVCRHVLFAAPFPSSPFGAEPQRPLLRIAEVLAWTGLHEEQFRRLERRGLALGQPLTPAGKRYYRKDLIRSQLFTPLLPTSWASATAPNHHTHARS